MTDPADALLFLRLSSASDIVTAAVGSDLALCGMTCKPGRLGVLQRFPEAILLLEYNCDTHNYKSSDRINVSAASGCATIRNAQRSDTGRYDWKFYDENGIFPVTPSARYNVMDKVSIINLTSRVSNSGLSTSFHVEFTGEQVTVTWSRDGGDLPEDHQLSDFNETLTVQIEDYGTYRVTVTNPVSEDHAECTLTGRESSSGRRRLSWIPLCVIVLPFLVWIFIKKKRETPGNSPHSKDEDTCNGSAWNTEMDSMERAEDAKADCTESAEC